MSMNATRRLKRSAWRYQGRKRPGVGALFGATEMRRTFFRAWFTEPAGFVLDMGAHFALKLLPIDTCSAVGAFLGRVVMPRKYPKSVLHMRHNLALMHPGASEGDIERMIRHNCESLGRLMTEFSVLPRICRQQERIGVHGLEALQEAAQKHPVILVALHLGNWEVLSCLSRRSGLAFHTFHLPLENPIESWVATRTRKQLGAKLLPVAMAGVRPALKILKQGGMVALFCDEGFDGQIRGPLLGRSPHLHGNLALAARLARHTGARLCLTYAVRTRDARFECHIDPVFALPEREGRNDDEALLQDVAFLNGLIEPMIIRHADQWYFLHYRHEEIALK